MVNFISIMIWTSIMSLTTKKKILFSWHTTVAHSHVYHTCNPNNILLLSYLKNTVYHGDIWNFTYLKLKTNFEIMRKVTQCRVTLYITEWRHTLSDICLVEGILNENMLSLSLSWTWWYCYSREVLFWLQFF